MSLELINLRKALQLCMLDIESARRALKREAYQDRRRIENPGDGGGDFYIYFWSDAKSYASQGTDLEIATSLRIESNYRLRRLYSILCPQFIEWWQRFQSSMNEEMQPLTESVHARCEFEELGVTMKVENLLSFRIDAERHRLIYPYFSEEPALSEEWARIGLWIMHQALDAYRIEDMVILDVQRARSFSVREIDLLGNEEEVFLNRMTELQEIWEEILEEAS